ncbi:hypothetical protein Tco_0581490 [Tanacetum coccineum]
MHTRASNSELVEPLPEPELTLNRRLRRQNKRVPYDQRNNPTQHPRIVYPLILNINYFRHFLDILRNYDPMDDEPMWAADRVVSLTPSSAITIPETANEFAIKGNHLTLVKGNQFDGRTKTCRIFITRIMHRTLMIVVVSTLCEEQVKWNSVLMRLIDDVLALDSIVRFGFSDQRLERTAAFSISTNLE